MTVRPQMAATAEDFAAEVDEIAPRLQESVQELYSPLGELARAHIRDSMPPRLGVVVLGAGLGERDTPLLREKRILLATALEMLKVALSIHRLLLVSGTDHSLDKSLVGSTILTGDYCFSRAASLAAQTESPVVVDLFAAALKSASEGHLRRILGADDAIFDEDAVLVEAGIRAVAHLVQHPAARLDALLRAAATLAAGPAPQPFPISELTPPQQARWQAAFDWLSTAPVTPAAD